jgi:H+/Cl- antiporter ClcA
MVESSQVEQLLRRALVPVEPPERLSDRLERRLAGITSSCAEELADWELVTMRDPRNWVRPAAAVVVGGAAGTALVVVRIRQQQKKGPRQAIGALGKRAGDLTKDIRTKIKR